MSDTTKPGVLARIAAAIRYVLALEPVRVQALLRAVFVFAALIGVNATDEVQQRVLLAVAGFYALVEVITTTLARARVTPDAKVVEVVEDGVVRAGPASELQTGTAIRPAGSLGQDGSILYPQTRD